MRKLLIGLLLTVATPIEAAWKVAASNHFTVYTEGSEEEARATAVLLEKYVQILRAMTGAKGEDSPLKPDIYMMPTQRAVAEAMPYGGGEGIAGFYSATIRGPYAVMLRQDRLTGVDRSAASRNMGMSAQHVLLHETTHHFMNQYFPAAYPTWYSEGFADFLGSTQIKANDVVEVGAPLGNRFLTIEQGTWLPLRTMLKARNYSEANGSIIEMYAQGWLLVHYLTTTKSRAGQLPAYLRSINAGMSYGEAAEKAFGDIGALDQELRAYAASGQLSLMVLPFKTLDPGPIATRRLTAAEEAMLPFRLALQTGVEKSRATTFADAAARAAADYPDDPAVLATLADAQRIAGQSAAAVATTERWLARAPADGEATAFKATLQMDALVAAKSADAAAWDGARALAIAAVKRAPQHPRVLETYYRSYAARGAPVPVTAQNALIRAHEILPQDDGLRVELAAELEREGAFDDAITVIKPLAVTIRDPETRSPAERARRTQLKARYALAENYDSDEVPAMLTRLEKKRAAAQLSNKPAG